MSAPRKGDPEQARQINTHLILDAVRKQDLVSRAELSRILSVSKMTTSTIVSDLIDKGLLVETDSNISGSPVGGRPPVLLTLDTAQNFIVGVDIGTTTVSLVVGNLKGRIIEQRRIPTRRDRTVESILEQVGDLVQELLDSVAIPFASVLGVGVSVAGLVEKKRGFVRFSPDFNWKDVEFQSLLQDRLQLPVVIDNCTRAAALGEMWYGAAVEAKTLFYVNVGYGIGSAVVIDGRAYEHASEFGHIHVTSSPLKCECGKMGCLEAVSSGRAIEQFANDGVDTKTETDRITAKELSVAARRGDSEARSIFEKAGKYLGRAISTVANLLSPELVIIGGGISRSGDLLMGPLEKEFEVHTMDAIIETTTIRLSKLGVDASVVGAMALALDAFVFHQSQLVNR
ncbi:MAG: ROK family transcriptional regulator [Spirochaeta sp.]|nr:ROK family transcriptional regulator [Spirochaeta sp.]